MKFIVVGDLHLRTKNPVSRIDDFPETQYQKLKEVFAAAISGGHHILCPGDVFDTPSPAYSLPTRYGELFRSLGKCKFVTTPGNHDIYGANLNTLSRSCLGVLHAFRCVELATENPYQIYEKGTEKIAIFGTSYMAQEKPVPLPGAFNILLAHNMVLFDKIWKEQDEFEYANEYLEKNKNWDLIVCGHYHYRFKYQYGTRMICNPGALVRVKASKGDLALRPGYFVFDTKSREITLHELETARPIGEVFTTKAKTGERNEVMDRIEEFVRELSTEGGIGTGKLSEIVVKVINESGCNERVGNLVRELVAEAEATV